MPAYLNNLHGRDHEGIYGDGAFFDLNTTGRQAQMVVGMQPGEEWIVASYNGGEVVFKTYLFDREENLTCEDGPICRVLFGGFVNEVTMPKTEARGIPRYQPLFNILGHFRRPSAFFAGIPGNL